MDASERMQVVHGPGLACTTGTRSRARTRLFARPATGHPWSRLRTRAGVFSLALAGGCVVLCLSGCLPSATVSTSPWKTFKEAKAAFDQVVPEQTTVEDLKAVGLHPISHPNVRLVMYQDVLKVFVPHEGITVAEHDPAIQRCFQAREKCETWRLKVDRVDKKRLGFFLLEWLKFRKQTRYKGWKFKGWVFIIDGRVVYKLWSGEPSILEFTDIVRPLGLLQHPIPGS